MPTNLYGPGDNFDLKTSHVLPAMIRKFHEAKEDGHRAVTLWGDGSPMREFLHSNDLAEALVFLMQNYSEKLFVNVGYGEDLTIKALAELIQKIVGHEGEMLWDISRPNGTPRKLMDSSRIQTLGWTPDITLEKGISLLYNDYKASL